MVWKIDDPQGAEQDKIAHLVIPYTRGRGLDVGCGMRKVWPHCIGVDNGHHSEVFNHSKGWDFKSEANDLTTFSDGSMDFVFSSHTLEHVVDYRATLKEWWRVLRIGGYLTLYLPHKELYPNMGQPGANPDHKHDFLPDDIIEAMKETGSWTLLENEVRSAGNEYSFFLAFQKQESGHEFKIWERNPNGKKRCLIVRYGAVGDQIVASSILPLLKDQGYHVTYNTTPESQQILLHNPHIDEWLLQDKDQVPNMQLRPYWEALQERYDKIVNLCESVEGGLLQLPGRHTHGYPDAVRQRLNNFNYLEITHDFAGVPYVFNPEFHATEEEIAEAHAVLQDKTGGKPAVVWVLNGSSPHKVYPWAQVVIAWLLERSDAHLFLMADPGIGLSLQVGIMLVLERDGAPMDRIHPTAGDWPIRKVLTFCKHAASVVVGPETGPLNAVGCTAEVPKVIYLSHSSHENLTKHWKNTTVLIPDTARAPCYPCHRLHSTWEHCHQSQETAAALCASAVSPERVFKAIGRALTAPHGELIVEAA